MLKVKATVIDPKIAARFVGQLLLEISTQLTGVCAASTVVEQWHKRLPDSWHQHAQLELLQV